MKKRSVEERLIELENGIELLENHGHDDRGNVTVSIGEAAWLIDQARCTALREKGKEKNSVDPGREDDPSSSSDLD